MIIPSNGVLSRIDAPSGVSSGGDVTFTTGSTISVDVLIDNPTRAQRYALGQQIADAEAVVYVLKDQLPAGVSINEGDRVTAAQEGEAAATYLVIKRQFRVFDELTHFELFVKRI